MSSELLQIGAVCRPHGLRGELRVRLHDAASHALDALPRIWIGPDLGEAAVEDANNLREWQIETSRRLEEGFYLLTLKQLKSRDGADGLRGHHLYAQRDDLPKLADEEVYLVDLIGCRVIDIHDREIGTAREIQDIAGNPLLVVERPNREAALVPLVPSILADVDLSARLVRIDQPEGLLDLDLVGRSSQEESVA